MKNCLKEESGLTLVETLMAVLILLVGLLAMAQVLTLSVFASKVHGRDAGRTTAYARAQMELLSGLPFNNAALNAGTYSDALNEDGSVNADGSPIFTRQWQITDDSATLKRVVVTVTRTNRGIRHGTPPATTIVSEITSP
jgi:Tfp pilus assembly protein PilV